MGRPSIFNQKVADEICERISSGQSLRKICSRRNMPGITSIFNWLAKYPEFEKQYAMARVESTNALFEEILEICDNATNDWMEANVKGKDRKTWVLNGEHVQRSKLRVDTRKWALSKLQPKKYGERIMTDHAGTIQFTTMTEDELDRRIKDIEREITAITQD